MKNKIEKIFTLPLKMVYSKINSVGYAKKIGVNVSGDLKIYGSSYSMFGTEPWLITLGDNVHITDGVKFITHDGGTLILRHKMPDIEITKQITIGSNVYIGVNVVILPGVNIGDNCIVGAGSIVTKDIPSNSVYAGVPARFIKSLDDYFEKIKSESLHIGHLPAKEKEIALKKHFGLN